MTRVAFTGGLLALALAVGACARTVASQSYVDTTELKVTRVAVIPFEPHRSYVETPDGVPGDEAATLVTRFVTEALAERGVQMIPAGDAMRVMGSNATPDSRLALRDFAVVLNREFGADGMVTGVVRRYRELTGQKLASGEPSSVSFQVFLYGAPSGAKLWTGTFDQTQEPLNSNLFKTAQYPGRGTRWLRADELAHWGAEQLAKEFPGAK